MYLVKNLDQIHQPLLTQISLINMTGLSINIKNHIKYLGVVVILLSFSYALLNK